MKRLKHADAQKGDKLIQNGFEILKNNLMFQC